MATTPAMNTTYKALQDMDKQIQEAEAHIRVLKAAGYPQTLKLESDLAKAKQSRTDLMQALETEMNR